MATSNEKPTDFISVINTECGAIADKILDPSHLHVKLPSILDALFGSHDMYYIYGLDA